ncbi:hypothetical protein CVD25_00990 [Bacillus canaveralius]|uniref:Fur-regulated basic protein FbpA n=1 Tax=Bacillus canaveralius TaxID=1403243 RepID=A0A2N5GPP1_9BACI|nr:hypothetical protein [Bacillus canaveralius]PLR84642.1 hypothetical protein CU635_06100 [Bacillus canaveralius]PLS00794.1 hypothetical protein CVD25_00990 [Bacillus canaveralius]
MGILYEIAMEARRKFVLDELRDMGVTVSQGGIVLDQLDYEELRYELVLASFRIRDQIDENKWF